MNAQSATYPIEHRPAPVRSKPLLSSGVAGMLIFIFTEAMFFAGLISAHAIVRSQVAGQLWPPYGQPRLPVEQTAVNSLALLLSGALLVLAWFLYRRKPSKAKIPLLLSVLLGTVFVVFQGVEWMALLADGLTIQSSTYGGFFYLIVGAHAIHAVGALGALVWAVRKLDRDELTASQLGTVSAFWYFVVLVWPILYLKVYL